MTLSGFLGLFPWSFAGVILGFALSQFVTRREQGRRAKSLKWALQTELREVNLDVKQKIAWLLRDVTGSGLKEPDSDRIIRIGDKQLYLGEREEFVASRPYWKEKYTEAVEALSPVEFSDFYGVHRAIDKFEQKFRQLKITFETNVGEKSRMAEAILDDLVAIGKDVNGKVERIEGRSNRL
jgi:hypothetical protein